MAKKAEITTQSVPEVPVIPDAPAEPVNKVQKKSNTFDVVTITVDNTIEEVLQFDKEGKTLQFDIRKFLEIPDEYLDKLSRSNFLKYFVTYNQVKQTELSKVKRPDPDYMKDWGIEPLGGNARNLMKKALRPRRGWHGFLCSPEELDDRLNLGYRIIQKLSSRQKKLIAEGKKTREELIGYEEGDRSVIGQYDKPDLIALEIPEEAYQKHLAYVGWLSKGKHEKYEGEYGERIRRIFPGLVPTKYGEEIKD